MKKNEIANELLKNTTNKYLKEFLSNCIASMQQIDENNCSQCSEELLRLNDCITYIESSNFNISGWQLREVPIYYAHIFYNEETGKMFDLDVFDIGTAMPTYIDSNSSEREADSIEDAIDRYCI